MSSNKDEYLWYTDLHLDKIFPWTFVRFIRHIIKVNPKGVFLTGDISNGWLLPYHLRILVNFIKCPIYFVLGNHDLHFSSIDKVHGKIRSLCKEFSNLIWLTEADVIGLNDEVAIIGAEGWYDAELGNPNYLRATLDWFLTKDFRQLPTWNDRINAFRKLSDESVVILEKKLEEAIKQKYKTVYILTHIPPWKNATNYEGTFFERYHLPYNVNLRLGKMIERFAMNKDMNIVVCAGHIHSDRWIRVANNIECKVNKAKYYGLIRKEEHIFL